MLQVPEGVPSREPPYLDGLPMQYWIVPPRTPLAAMAPVLPGSGHLQRGRAMATAWTAGTAAGSRLRYTDPM